MPVQHLTAFGKINRAALAYTIAGTLPLLSTPSGC